MTQSPIRQNARHPGLRVAGALAAAAMMALASAIPARAEITPITQSGLWTAYSNTGPDNRRVCGISTTGADGRRIAIQQLAGESGLQLSLQKDSWDIPEGAPVELRLQFDLNDQIPAHATGSGKQINLTMTFDQSVPFMRSLRAGRQVRVFFLTGNEPVWTGGLLGSSRSIDAFNDCRASMAAPSGPTQPYTPPPQAAAPVQPVAPTQPFAAPPASTTDLPPIPPAPAKL